jgi:hypothetical protein
VPELLWRRTNEPLMIREFAAQIPEAKRLLSFLNEASVSVATAMYSEADIPTPDVHYEMPNALIGEFVLVSDWLIQRLYLFSSNKFIWVSIDGNHPSNTFYGHIAYENGRWFLEGLNYANAPPIQFDNLELVLDDDGFSLVGMRALRREELPAPVKQAANIFVMPERRAKRQHFVFNDAERTLVDYNEIYIVLPDSSYFYTHDLMIDSGYVWLTTFLQEKESRAKYFLRFFAGIIETVEETTDLVRGTIRFINGIINNRHIINDNMAEIEIHNDGSLTITMLYTPDAATLERLEAYDRFEFPARLVLEF